ncbi:MAG: pyridoxamine 5'-phosphate oxidase family protein [Haloferacaceae archaeon]
MSDQEAVTMDDDERDEFLGNGGTGVVSLSTTAEDPPHSIPVSYGYDATDSTFYFRLAVGEESEKGDLDDRPVSFVTYRSEAGTWRSVVARGRLEATTDDAIATETLDGLDRVRIPLVDIFGKPSREVEFEFYRLVPDQLTGREESPTGV